MPGTGDRIRALVLEITLRKRRIAAPAGKLSAKAVGTVDDSRMMVAGDTLRTYQEVAPVNFVDMRPFVTVEMLLRADAGLGQRP